VPSNEAGRGGGGRIRGRTYCPAVTIRASIWGIPTNYRGGDGMKTHCARVDRLFPAVIALAFALSIPSIATADLITLRLPGIQGNVSAVGQEGTIEVLSLSQGSTAAPAIGTSGRENTSPVFSDLNILKRLDLSSPSLFLVLVKGSIFNNAVITFLHETAGGFVKFFSITLTNVSVTQFQRATPRARFSWATNS
jgi:type VI protein secretion system component Hcp